MELLGFHLQWSPRQPSLGSHKNGAIMTSSYNDSVDEASQCMIQFVYDFYDFLAGLTDEDFEDHVS